MLAEPERTPYDLQWHLFGIPVRVHPFFWLVGALGGWGAISEGFEFVLMWIACLFISILVHELGHVWMGQAFGRQGSIVLYAFGGLAIGSNALSSHWKRIAVSFAGPLAGFLFLGLIVAALFLFSPEHAFGYWSYSKLRFLGIQSLDREEGLFLGQLARRENFPFGLRDRMVLDLIWINLFWGLINLLPVWPLDGGQISADFLTWLKGPSGYRAALLLSLVVAATLAINSIMVMNDRPLLPFLPFGSMFMTILFAMLAIQSYQLLSQQGPSWHDPWGGEGRPWERNREKWDR